MIQQRWRLSHFYRQSVLWLAFFQLLKVRIYDHVVDDADGDNGDDVYGYYDNGNNECFHVDIS